jgi:hypothetical protein
MERLLIATRFFRPDLQPGRPLEEGSYLNYHASKPRSSYSVFEPRGTRTPTPFSTATTTILTNIPPQHSKCATPSIGHLPSAALLASK